MHYFSVVCDKVLCLLHSLAGYVLVCIHTDDGQDKGSICGRMNARGSVVSMPECDPRGLVFEFWMAVFALKKFS